jgi:hypothetical protein
MKNSLIFRNNLTAFCINRGDDRFEVLEHLSLLNLFDIEAEKNKEFRVDVNNWMNKKTSTIKLRELCLKVKYNYWADLRTSNIIDTFDALC